jgi:pimeloyl-ACP methyl ester carboxylesterase
MASGQVRGLIPGVFFFRDFIKKDGANDGQTGIIAVELMPIIIRITKGILSKPETLAEILKILDHHGWDKFSVMGHSYGTIITTHILQHLGDTGRLGPMLLVDPVTISIHWGGVPYNFLYRKPRKASEWQLHCFASTDMCVPHSITRRFDWLENVLWKSQMIGRTMTVALASRDIIIDTNALQEYLVGDAKLKSQLANSRDVLDKQWKPTQEGLDVIWYGELNHAEMFDSAEARRPLVKILHTYCSILE